MTPHHVRPSLRHVHPDHAALHRIVHLGPGGERLREAVVDLDVALIARVSDGQGEGGVVGGERLGGVQQDEFTEVLVAGDLRLSSDLHDLLFPSPVLPLLQTYVVELAEGALLEYHLAVIERKTKGRIINGKVYAKKRPKR